MANLWQRTREKGQRAEPRAAWQATSLMRGKFQNMLSARSDNSHFFAAQGHYDWLRRGHDVAV